jgi:hypothetical protein
MPLIYRNAGAWGPGKGARLTSLEADGNVHALDSRVRNLEDNPPEAIGIDHFSVSGNALTIVLSNGSTHGPFTLPSASWRWAGEWQPLTLYYTLDLVAQGGSIYLVQHNHTSDATFAADAEDIEGFRYARLLTSPDQPYDVGMFHASVIPGDGGLLLQHVATRSFVLPVGFDDSTAFLLTPVETDSIALPIHKNGELIGHIEFNPGEGIVGADEGQLGIFVAITPVAEVQFHRTDRLTVFAPDVADGSAADLSITFAARTGTI